MSAAGDVPAAVPLSLNEARGWLRLGSSADDAVVAGLVRAATNICEAFIGQWLIERAVEEVVPIGADGAVRLTARPVAAVEAVTLLAADGSATALEPAEWRLTIGRDGTGRLAIERRGAAARARVAYRAGMATDANAIPEAIRQGIMRMTQHMHDARGDAGAAPPAVIAALWQPWRRIGLGGAA
jgi:uncharacterized phiE125 gp8 family phage protein